MGMRRRRRRLAKHRRAMLTMCRRRLEIRLVYSRLYLRRLHEECVLFVKAVETDIITVRNSTDAGQ